jgi:hypothetical protein
MKVIPEMHFPIFGLGIPDEGYSRNVMCTLNYIYMFFLLLNTLEHYFLCLFIQLAREAELKVKIKQRKRFLRKLHRMHQMAMANNAATNRFVPHNSLYLVYHFTKNSRDV